MYEFAHEMPKRYPEHFNVHDGDVQEKMSTQTEKVDLYGIVGYLRFSPLSISNRGTRQDGHSIVTG